VVEATEDGSSDPGGQSWGLPARQEVTRLAVMGLSPDAPLVRISSYKTLVAAVANGASGVVFIFLAPVSWPHVLVLAVARLAGGRLGASLDRVLPEGPLRAGIAVFGLLVAARLAVGGQS
jgi:uncharacterized protein